MSSYPVQDFGEEFEEYEYDCGKGFHGTDHDKETILEKNDESEDESLIHDQLIDLAEPLNGTWNSSDEDIWYLLQKFDEKLDQDKYNRVSLTI